MAQPVEIPPDPTAAVQAAEAEVPPALIAQTLGEYARAWIGRMRGGDIGVLPVVVGLVAIMVVFEIISPNHRGHEFEGYERSVDSHVKNLRRKIEPDPANPSVILTVMGGGYRFGLTRDA